MAVATSGRCDPTKQEQADLSGTYTGKADQGNGQPAQDMTLTINGNNFTMTSGSETHTGRITAVATCGYIGVTMMMGDLTPPAPSPNPPAPLPAVSLRAKKVGDKLWLTSVPGEKMRVSFIPTGAGAPPVTRRHSIAGQSGPPTPVATPSVAPSPTPNQLSIDEIRSKMQFGNIAFNVPPVMRLEKTETIELLLSLKQTIADLVDSLHNRHVAGEIKTARIQIDKNMQATLTGDGFKITPVTPETLPISSQEITKWQWDVRPIRSGTLYLHVVVNAMIDLKDGSGVRPYPMTSFDQTYQVEVPWSKGVVATFVKNNLQWLWVVVVAPVGLWAWNFVRKKRNRAGFI